eukprot:CAMPEP_0202971656 /NCGR_PEP_ID=MMETSP1396-20130829/29198_1 /ASSEMBLY_ACC=CAM_ASM_000872 /TAXON_ID= /ORGANISM="Pseudokeronopsis sp., Strain Brazil" /LENGTH=98 /DNA_ID=CAMNT_0049701243 /DNA_START=159 /DNA_END=455 /DNA_ORIENTATION=-
MASWGQQYSTGDQSHSNRVKFWKSGFRTCPCCDESEIQSVCDCAGCRRNGDAYGTEVFTCRKCQWTTSFQYDDASDTYYYETRFWKITEIPQTTDKAK